MPLPIIFHKEIRERLKREYQSGVLPQSLLFTGPYGVGKETLARWCAAMVGSQPPDLYILGQDRSSESIGIEEVRTVQEHLTRTPLKSPCAVAVILYAERLTVPSQQAILKHLEEPRPYARIILTAARAALLIPTIVSRVVEVKLKPVPASLLQRALVAEGVEEEEAHQYAIASCGVPGWLLVNGRLRRDLQEKFQETERLARLQGQPFWQVRRALKEYVEGEEDGERTRSQTFERIYSILSRSRQLPLRTRELFAEIIGSAGKTTSTDQLIDAAAMAISNAKPKIQTPK